MKSIFLHLLLATLYIFAWKADAHQPSEPSVPILFIPGYAASSPVEGELSNFLFRRGFSPKKLKLSPSYYTLMSVLKQKGYKNGKTLFKAVYDWRMTLAPMTGILTASLKK